MWVYTILGEINVGIHNTVFSTGTALSLAKTKQYCHVYESLNSP